LKGITTGSHETNPKSLHQLVGSSLEGSNSFRFTRSVDSGSMQFQASNITLMDSSDCGTKPNTQNPKHVSICSNRSRASTYKSFLADSTRSVSIGRFQLFQQFKHMTGVTSSYPYMPQKMNCHIRNFIAVGNFTVFKHSAFASLPGNLPISSSRRCCFSELRKQQSRSVV
jgi:hypothetical protein